jgi:hypothetical protein
MKLWGGRVSSTAPAKVLPVQQLLVSPPVRRGWHHVAVCHVSVGQAAQGTTTHAHFLARNCSSATCSPRSPSRSTKRPPCSCTPRGHCMRGMLIFKYANRSSASLKSAASQHAPRRCSSSSPTLSSCGTAASGTERFFANAARISPRADAVLPCVCAHFELIMSTMRRWAPRRNAAAADTRPAHAPASSSSRGQGPGRISSLLRIKSSVARLA